jgi:hypothetical protein
LWWTIVVMETHTSPFSAELMDTAKVADTPAHLV